MFINIDELTNRLEINEDRLHSIASSVLKDYYEEEPDFTLSFVDPERIRELNKTWRNVDSVTDVLSFESDGEIDPETGKEYLGDILICPAQAKLQADISGHGIEEEISLLLIHGLLHLLGYDHLDDEQKAEMWKYQDLYLSQCHVKLNRKPGEDFEF